MPDENSEPQPPPQPEPPPKPKRPLRPEYEERTASRAAREIERSGGDQGANNQEDLSGGGNESNP
jgi:hypothetical protein